MERVRFCSCFFNTSGGKPARIACPVPMIPSPSAKTTARSAPSMWNYCGQRQNFYVRSQRVFTRRSSNTKFCKKCPDDQPIQPDDQSFRFAGFFSVASSLPVHKHATNMQAVDAIPAIWTEAIPKWKDALTRGAEVMRKAGGRR